MVSVHCFYLTHGILSPLLYSDRTEDQLGFTYVQGMNVLAAPFLYTMPSEIEAFFCFAKFIEEACPLYVQPTLEGVHKGLRVCFAPQQASKVANTSQLLDRCLKFVDPELYAHLRTKNLSAELYAFPCMPLSTPCYCGLDADEVLAVLTLCACTPPLDQVLQLWDFLLAFGVHLNVLCVIAQLLLMRDEVMASPRCVKSTHFLHFLCSQNLQMRLSPMRLLRTFPPLEAIPVIGIAVTLVRDLPADLYDELVRHPYEVSQP